MNQIKSTGGEYSPPVFSIRWDGTLFFIFIHSVALIGTPLYLFHHGVTGAEWLLFSVYLVCSSMAITVGYHRLFSHATFKTNAFVRFVLLYFGAATFEQSALRWASQHRQHHLFTDTDKDPYNINKGFWYAHFGWIIFWKHRVNYDNVVDLKKSRLLMSQHHWYPVWSTLSALVVPMAIGTAIGKPLGAFVMAVCLRLVLVMNSAFFINSFAHTFGKKTHDGEHTAGDHWLGAIITNGEGYHSYHHRYPGDYRNGVRWYHWDPTKWLIFVLYRLGLARDLRRIYVETHR